MTARPAKITAPRAFLAAVTASLLILLAGCSDRGGTGGGTGAGEGSQPAAPTPAAPDVTMPSPDQPGTPDLEKSGEKP